MSDKIASMTRMGLALALALALATAACGGGDKGGAPDADLSAPVCTGVVYDNCTSSSQCGSGQCHLFSGEFQVCTQACTPNDNSSCPVSANGMESKCNMRGICKPAVNNACRPPS